jgi:DNA repair exonuclease SbcCD ATPase subunit
MYTRSPFIFANEVRKINNRISQEEPLENMLDEINYITRKYDIFKTKIKSSTFTALQNLKDTVSYKKELNSIQSSYTDTSNTLIQSKKDLETALKDLEDCEKLCNNNGGVRSGFKIKDVTLVVDTTFKKEYLIYIRDYGIPTDGIFLESILEYIKDINNI